MNKIKINKINKYALSLITVATLSCSSLSFGMNIFDAIETNNVKKVKEILKEKGFDINKANIFGNTPLHLACYNNNLGIATLLIASGAQKPINIVKHTNWKPLLWACYNNNLKIVKLLLDDACRQLGKSSTKEYINRTDKDGLNVLAWACRDSSIEIVKLLLDCGAQDSINKADKYGNTPFLITCEKNDPEIVKLLLKYACRELDESSVKEFINKANDDDCTPLYFACKNNNTDMVKLFLIHDAQESISKVNNCFMTPLFWACKNNNSKMVKLLLANGADIDQKSFFNAEGKPKILKSLNAVQNYETATNKKKFISENSKYYEMLAKRALTKYSNEIKKNEELKNTNKSMLEFQ